MEQTRRIKTERLILEPVKIYHTADLFQIFSHPEAMTFWDTPQHESATDTGEMIESFMQPDASWWSIFLPEADRVIGLVGYLGNPGIPGMGYILHPNYWQRGYMREAVSAALTYGFEKLKLDRVELWINENNLASQRLAQEVGFLRRGRFRQKYWHHQTAHDKIVYGLRAEEWQSEQEVVEPNQSHNHFYTLQPVLSVSDVQSTAEYYRDKLGFRIDFMYGNPPFHGAVSQGEWSTEGVKIQLSATDATPESHNSAVVLYIFVGPNIDALYQQYRANGVHIQRRIADYPWGMREFDIKDCNGYTIRFGTPK